VFHLHHIRSGAVACGIAIALAVPATAVAQQDLRSPDARDAARAQEQTASPGASQILTDRQRAIVEAYKRSPDYQATLRAATLAGAPEPAQVSSGSGLDWVDAGIGAAGTLAVVLIALGGVVAVHHRRQATPAH
jgi:hypothetical protein